ncbi:alpha/beta hydrolase [Streptomyces sp. SCSIO 75703]|uniref:alpha/beta hydrolase n=1 Tax=unclassified Streptomyces TaxID=2593676 RepID=UPI0006B417E7|nr:alpha/beta hydrolase [Streptomyces sp. TP-A0875]
MNLATLKRLKPSEFEEAAHGYRATSDMANEAKDHLDRVVAAGMRKSLRGEALEAALGELKNLAANFHYVQIECGLVGTALGGFAHDVGAARRKLLSALDDADAMRFTVDADGGVTYPDVPAGGDEEKPARGGTVGGSSDRTARALARQAAGFDPNPHHAKALAIADRIADALRQAAEADAKWEPRITALTADDDLTVSDRDLEDAQSDMTGVREAAQGYLDSIGGPPEGGDAQGNSAWWEGLSPEERAAYLSLHPDVVGRLDGLPSEVRDEANRVVLDEKQAEFRLRLDSLPSPPANEWTWITAGGYPAKVHTDAWMEWDRTYGDEYRHLKSSLKGMKDIQERFDRTGEDGLPEAYLLGFDPQGNGRAVIANGNPDTARHQAVYVPGTGSNLGTVGGDIERMTQLWRQTQKATPDASVSTITWLGYDAPQDVVRDAPFEHYAYDGAPAYRRFMEGLEVSHSGPGEPHRTAIGHSYGTTVIGAAAQTGHLDADDVILAGSPGVKVGSAEEMDVPRGHVWNAEAEGDVVPDIGRWGHGGSQWKLGGGVFIVPSDEVFGARQVNTGAEGSGPTATAAAEGHSEYWNRGTTALKNQALVVVGEYGDVTAPR